MVASVSPMHSQTMANFSKHRAKKTKKIRYQGSKNYSLTKQDRPTWLHSSSPRDNIVFYFFPILRLVTVSASMRLLHEADLHFCRWNNLSFALHMVYIFNLLHGRLREQNNKRLQRHWTRNIEPKQSRRISARLIEAGIDLKRTLA